jgi:hypothetical protein
MGMVSKDRQVETAKPYSFDSQGYGFESAPCIKARTSAIPDDAGMKKSNDTTRASWSSSVPKGKGKGHADT